MKYGSTLVVAFATLVVLVAGAAWATTLTLPDSSQTTMLTADVSEQATVTVPAGVTFDVVDINSATPATAASVDITNIVLAAATKELKVSLQAGTANFTPPVALATTWAASDVSWNAPAWTNATGNASALSSAVFNEVATSDAGVASASTAALVFTLAAKGAVQRSGNHTLSVTWKFESIAP